MSNSFTPLNVPAKVFIIAFVAVLLLSAAQWIYVKRLRRLPDDVETTRIAIIGKRYLVLRVTLVVIMFAMAAIGMKLE